MRLQITMHSVDLLPIELDCWEHAETLNQGKSEGHH